MRIGLKLIAWLSAAAFISPLAAHHSVSGQFDMSRETTWTGVISRVDWINPHSYIFLDVTDAEGTVTTWQFASAPVAMLRKAGLTKDMLVGNGAAVTITGLPARDGTAHLGWIHRITYPDGHFYQLSR